MSLSLNSSSQSSKPIDSSILEKVANLKNNKVAPLLRKAFPLLFDGNEVAGKLLEASTSEAIALYTKKWELISEDQVLPWLEKQTLLMLAEKVKKVGLKSCVAQNLCALDSAAQYVEFIPWLLDTLGDIAISQDLEVPASVRTTLLPKRTGESESGTTVNGSYVVKKLVGEEAVPVAIMKPSDEETGAPNCPKVAWRKPSERAFQGIMPGEGPMREHVAYLLGKDLGVPYTMFCEGVECSEFIGENKKKTVSLQAFVPKSTNFDRGLKNSEKTAKLKLVSEENIRKIALLDIRLYNSDRGAWNLMITDENELVPIDHGAVLSTDMLKDPPNFCWMVWDHAHSPLSSANLSYIREMNWEKDKEMILT